MLSRSSIMVLCFGWDLFPRVKLNLHEDLHTHEHTLNTNYFKDTLSVSALGYEKCFVSKGYHNVKLIYLSWFEIKQTLPGFCVTRFTSAFASGSFSARFPGLVPLGRDNLFIPRHFQRLITGKLTGPDPGRPQSLQTKKGRSNKLTEIIQ